MQILRTPEDRFAQLSGYPFAPHYLELAYQGQKLRMHYVDEGPKSGSVVFLLHGEPTWSYLYRKMIPILAAAGHRVIAPDMIGFGRSDKLARREDYSYQFHVDLMTGFVEGLGLREVNLFVQDWGSLIGLRVAAEHPERFARLVISNGGLPTGDHPMNEAFFSWQRYSQSVEHFDCGKIVQSGCVSTLAPEVIEAYNAPFPDESYLAGARQFPMSVPNTPDNPASEANRKAWIQLRQWTRPVLTAFSDRDPVTHGIDQKLQQVIPGARGQNHATIRDAGHFLQEDKGEELARVVVDFIARTA